MCRTSGTTGTTTEETYPEENKLILLKTTDFRTFTERVATYIKSVVTYAFPLIATYKRRKKHENQRCKTRVFRRD